MGKWFKALKGAPKTRPIVGFDIEGVGGREGFVCGAIVGDTIRHFYTNRFDMLEDLQGLARDGFWAFAHNLQYDLPILEGDEFPIGDLLFNRYSLLWSEYPKWGRAVRIYDSGNLFPRHRVADIGEMVHLPKLELPPTILERLSQGAPWSHFSARDQALIENYCLRDAEIIYLGVANLQEITNRLGGQLRPTISGVAMDIYRRHFHRWPWPVVGDETNKLARPAFYGGRTENFAVGTVPGVNMYDVTSLYPSVQRTARFPHPAQLKLNIEVGKDRGWLKGEGVVSCRVRVPEWFIPPLPHRFSKRLFFPYGEMSGTWTILEIREALAYGVELLSVDFVLYAAVTFNPFVDFIEDLFGLRQHYLDQGSGFANMVKLILNSLYGRWGLDPSGGLYHLINIDRDFSAADLEGYSTHELGNHLYAYGPIRETRPPDYINLFFAAQISAAGRLQLYDELLRQGEDAVYCDTDSIITRGVIPTGTGLGAWREEMTGGNADLIGPKEYALHNAVVGDRFVVKGVPPDVAKAYIQTGAARFFRAVGVREGLTNGKQPATWIETFRSARDVFPKRYPLPAFVDGPPGWRQTRPYSVQELPLVCQGYYSGSPELAWNSVPKLPLGLKPRQTDFLAIAPQAPLFEPESLI